MRNKNRFKMKLAKNLCMVTLMVSTMALKGNSWFMFGEVDPPKELIK